MASHSGTQKGPATQLVPIAGSRKPRILVAACGCVGAATFGQICRSFTDWAEVKAVATRAGLFFIDRATIPSAVNLYTDKEELSSWSKLGDPILHVELRQWADILLIAPLSANTLAKVLSLRILKYSECGTDEVLCREYLFLFNIVLVVFLFSPLVLD